MKKMYYNKKQIIKNDRKSEFEERMIIFTILRGINGNMSFSVIMFLI